MLDTYALAAALTLLAPPSPALATCGPATTPVDPDAYEQLWEAGQTMDAFLAGADRRQDHWTSNWALSEEIDASVLARARAVGGDWKVLSVAVAGCSDSVNTVPFLGRLASLVDGIDMRIVDADDGRWIMEDNRTPDGRPATPTFILLGPDYEKKGCFIERPVELQTTLIANPDGIDGESPFNWKMAWYEDDAGATTVEEFVGILEAAARGEMVCG